MCQMTRAPSPQCGSLHVTPPIMLLMMASRARDIGYLFTSQETANDQSLAVRRTNDLTRQIQTVAALFGGTTDKPFGLARQRPSPISVKSPVTSVKYADPPDATDQPHCSMRRVQFSNAQLL